MYSKKYFLKSLAIFMALNILTQVLAPTVSMALTSGPTTPEVASFEPVDTTDMVNLATGDFTYNIPLLEVPGPEGGYPIALSYNAGILPGQDASWVGLGWNINPGAINRTVNQFADDYNGAVLSVSESWAGGIQREYSIGVGLGMLDAPVMGGINVSIKSDTYKGMTGSFGLNVKTGNSLGAFSMDINQDYSAIGIQNAQTGLTLTAGTSSDNKWFMSLSKEVSNVSVGISMESKGFNSVSKTMTNSFVQSAKTSGKINTSSNGFNVPLQFGPFYLSVGYKYTRYWIDQQANTALYGVLNSKNATDRGSLPDEVDKTRAFDSGILVDPTRDLVEQSNLDICPNPEVPLYDSYTVLAQGLTGSIEPVLADNGSLFQHRSDIVNGMNQVGQSNPAYYITPGSPDYNFPRRFTKSKHFFRFLNDFSNSHRVSASSFNVSNFNYPGTDLAYEVQDINYRGYRKILDANNKVIEARFAGSKHIEYYTNNEISGGTAHTNGFIDYVGLNNSPYHVMGRRYNFKDYTGNGITYNVGNNIGGYSITNECGVTYHYALPVYTYGFYQKTIAENKGNGRTQRIVNNKSPYAYTWLLTSITGPDFIDKNDNGVADANDWGYWVNFHYAEASHNYGFRTPDVGNTIDIDGAKTYSQGLKEIYYLSAIETRSHAALFVKTDRNDAKGVDAIMGNYVAGVSAAKRLDEIFIIENSKFNNLTNTYFGSTSAETFATKISRMGLVTSASFTAAAKNDFRNNSIKRIGFEYETLNPLCPNTPNSSGTPATTTLAKLTLAKIRHYGLNSVQLMPSTNFSYGLENPVADASMTISMVPIEAGTSSRKGRLDMGGANDFQEGDIITFTVNNKKCYTTLVKAIPGYGYPNGYYDVIFLGEPASFPVVADKGVSASAVQTKNPPYTQDFYDVWGMFKSDYVEQAGAKYNTNHATSAVSSKAVDCWSLRSIETPVGTKIKINYNSDSYNNVVLKNYSILNVKPEIGTRYTTEAANTYLPTQRICENLNGGNLDGLKVFFYAEELSSLPLSEMFTVNDEIILNTIGTQYWYSCPDRYTNYANCFSGDEISVAGPSFYYKNKFTINEIGSDYLILKDPKGIYFKNDQLIVNVTFFMGDPNVFWHNNSFIQVVPKKEFYGGGIRVSSIVADDNVTQKETKYIYSTGTTAYMPNSYDELKFDGASELATASKKYRQAYFSSYAKILSSAKNITSPGVLYENVTVKTNVTKENVVTPSPVYQSFGFQPFEEGMVSFNKIDSTSSGTSQSRVTKIVNNTAQVGNLLYIKNYDRAGNLLKETTNNYTSLPENNQGIIEQVFHSDRNARDISTGGTGFVGRFGVVTILSDLPSVLQSTTTRNYAKGITTTTTNAVFDFYTGNVTEKRMNDSYGNTIISISDPAYNYDIQGGMGLKLHMTKNAHMLSQISNELIIKKDATQKSLAVTIGRLLGDETSLYITLAPNVKLPATCHVGSRIGGLSKAVFISSINLDRRSFIAIGSKNPIDLGNNKTILVDDGAVLSATNTGWSDQWNYRLFSGTDYENSVIKDVLRPNPGGTVQNEEVWRKKWVYVWNTPYANPDGSYLSMGTGKGAFTWFVSPYDDDNWKLVSNITLYTPFSKPLESIDIKSSASSMKFAGNETRILANAQNALYTEFTHSGAEFAESAAGYAEGEVYGSAYRSTDKAHSGNCSFKIPAGAAIKYATTFAPISSIYTPTTFYKNNRTYRISAWVDKSSAIIYNANLYYTITNGGNSTTIIAGYDPAKHITCGNWVLLTMDFNTPAVSTKLEVGIKNISAGTAMYVDDFRFQPNVSAVSSYVYDNNTGLITYMLDGNNRYTRYEYDDKYRLKATYKETTNGEVKINEYNYNTSRPIPD